MFFYAAKPPGARSRQSRRLAKATDEDYATVERKGENRETVQTDHLPFLNAKKAKYGFHFIPYHKESPTSRSYQLLGKFSRH